MKNTKKVLDKLLLKYKAQPVGSSYIDIIVSRLNYQKFIKEILENKYKIRAISWWEYIPDIDTPNTYGMCGPTSKFYDGKFAEAPYQIDDIEETKTDKDIINLIENKVLCEYHNEIISFKNTQSLTPAIWLDVDKKWKSRDLFR
ncbi:hypothetical protein VH441_01425 [Psychrobacter sp. HD31]|uniref:hypothetical protein n=1 Tax=Psychrobacter sp. HD31 TaxID=3112003 RepID=UPI003DA69A40